MRANAIRGAIYDALAFAWLVLQWVILLGLPALFVLVLFPMYVRWATIAP